MASDDRLASRPDPPAAGALALVDPATETQVAGPLAAQRSLGILIEAVSEYAIFALDPDGLVMTWNVGAHRIKGYSTSEILGRHFSIFYTPSDIRAGVPARELAEATTRGQWRGEGWRVRHDGAQFWANVLISAVFDRDGHLEGFTKVTRDETDRKEIEENTRKVGLLLERDRVALALHDGVVHRIFEAALALDSARPFIADPEALRRLSHAGEVLDSTLAEIRRVVNDLNSPAASG